VAARSSSPTRWGGFFDHVTPGVAPDVVPGSTGAASTSRPSSVAGAATTCAHGPRRPRLSVALGLPPCCAARRPPRRTLLFRARPTSNPNGTCRTPPISVSARHRRPHRRSCGHRARRGVARPRRPRRAARPAAFVVTVALSGTSTCCPASTRRPSRSWAAPGRNPGAAKGVHALPSRRWSG
jgi:hypothetical protein